ncbi:MAG: hypothetical protein ACSHXY_06040 [Alphaproteobacteria bacterium]
MSLFNLPRLQSGNTNMPPPATPGKWQKVKDLGVISSSLETGDQVFSLDEVKSIPTLWGRVAVFEDALSDPTHLAHLDAVAKWRALIALVALREDKSFGAHLNILPIKLSADANVSNVFIDIVDKQRSKRTMDGPDGWSTLYMMTHRQEGKNQLIGILSPSTLVAPARSPHLSDLKHPWMNYRDSNGNLDIRDPLENASWLTPDQMKVISSFLQSIGKNVKDKGLNDHTTIGLDCVIAKFESELIEHEAGAAIAKIERGMSNFVPNIPQTSILRSLNTSITTRAPKGLVTDCQIKSDVTIGDKKMTLILADSGLADQEMYDKPADRISLVNQNMLGGSNELEQIRAETHKAYPDVLLLTPDDIFSPFLTPLEGANIPNHPDGLQDFLLPFKPAVFLFLKASDLKTFTEVRGIGTDRLTVTLRVEIIERNGAIRPYNISKNYEHNREEIDQTTTGRVLANEVDAEGIMKASAPAALAAWPNFQADFWHQNYLYSVSQPGYSPVVTSGISRRMLMADLDGLTTSESVFERLNQWAHVDGPWHTRELPSWVKMLMIEDPDDGADAKKMLQKSDYPFTASIFTVRADAAGYVSSQPVFAGIGLMEKAERVTPGEDSARIAVDYGTTNTTVYTYFRGKSDPVKFEPRLRRCSINEGRDATFNYRGFMPSEQVGQPFTTVAQIRSFTVEGGVETAVKGQEKELLFKDYAFFDDDVTDMLHMINDPDYGGGLLRFGLKWSEASSDRSIVGRYIGHLALLSLGELASKGVHPDKVKWMFSFPMSMKHGGQEYRNLVKNDALKVFGVKPDNILFVTESDAALEYFDKVQGIETPSRILLDIGGGTVDIGIVVSNKPVWRHSLQLAGSDLVTNFIGNNRSFIGEIGLDSIFPKVPKANYDAFNTERSNPYAERPDNPVRKAVNAIVNTRKYAESFQSSYASRSGEPSFKMLKAGAFLMLGGLLYYVGMQIRALEDKEGVLPKREGVFNSVEVCFAGRGSSLFADLKSFEEFSFRKIHSLLFAGLGADGRVSTSTFAEDVKHEAAAGMIEMDELHARRLSDSGLESEADKIARVLGVDVDLVVGGENKSFTTLAQLTDITNDQDAVIREIDSGEFYAFLSALEEATGLRIDADQAMEGITQKALLELNDMLESRNDSKHKGADIHSVNPPFIAMLKETLNLLYRGEHVRAYWEH